MQYLASNNCSFNLDGFNDKSSAQGQLTASLPSSSYFVLIDVQPGVDTPLGMLEIHPLSAKLRFSET